MQDGKERKRGGQPGNSNRLKHGKYSQRLRADRRAKGLVESSEKQRQAAEWMASMPVTDWNAIFDGIAADKARRNGSLN